MHSRTRTLANQPMLGLLVYVALAFGVHTLAVVWALDTTSPLGVVAALVASMAAAVVSGDSATLSTNARSSIAPPHGHLALVAHLALTGAKIPEAQQAAGVAILTTFAHYRCALRVV